jgi:hypothetical protein
VKRRTPAVRCPATIRNRRAFDPDGGRLAGKAGTVQQRPSNRG